ncbi:MAG: hypothetical protein HY075_09970 [Deltaproteobacteria bacterium]|nr:hypothetical protein [Deltaproteobacteria bacterium]
MRSFFFAATLLLVLESPALAVHCKVLDLGLAKVRCPCATVSAICDGRSGFLFYDSVIAAGASKAGDEFEVASIVLASTGDDFPDTITLPPGPACVSKCANPAKVPVELPGSTLSAKSLSTDGDGVFINGVELYYSKTFQSWCVADKARECRQKLKDGYADNVTDKAGKTFGFLKVSNAWPPSLQLFQAEGGKEAFKTFSDRPYLNVVYNEFPAKPFNKRGYEITASKKSAGGTPERVGGSLLRWLDDCSAPAGKPDISDADIAAKLAQNPVKPVVIGDAADTSDKLGQSCFGDVVDRYSPGVQPSAPAGATKTDVSK